MKNFSKLISGLVAVAVACSVVSTASAQNVTQLRAKVVRISGNARFTTGNGVWQPLKVGDNLRAGTVIQTDSRKGSYVDLVLGDASGIVASTTPVVASTYASPVKNSYQPKAEQNVVRVWENSALGIDKLTSTESGADAVTETQLDLKAGHIMGTVKKLSGLSKYEVKIPNGVAGIRGSLYELWATGVLKVGVGLGVLAWVGGDGNVNSKEVHGGYQFDPATGETSPITASDFDGMREFESSLRGFSHGEPEDVGNDRDHTIYHVSPHRHHGHGNGNGGGNGEGG
jgi:hypothetical protein